MSPTQIKFSLILSEVEGRGGHQGQASRPSPFDFAQDEGLGSARWSQTPLAHSREGGDLDPRAPYDFNQIPAFAGMSGA